MAIKYGIGCKDIKAGEIGTGGTMGTTLVSVGKIYKNTVSFIEEDGTVTKHVAENNRFPFLAVYEAGGLPLKFTLVDVSAQNLQKWLGGTVATDTWSASVESFSQELSVEIETLYGVKIQIPRCFLVGKITWNASRTEIAKIDVSGEVMLPEDEATPPIKEVPSV